MHSRRSAAPWIGMGISLLLHAMAGSMLLALPGTSHRPPIELEVLDAGGGDPRGESFERASGRAAALPRPGGDPADLLGPPGPRGGHPAPYVALVHLVRTPSPLAMQEGIGVTPLAQLQRIRSAPRAGSPLPRRATPHPADDRFLASGVGSRRTRMPRGRIEARSGAPRPAPSRRASHPLSDRGDPIESRPSPGPRHGSASRLPTPSAKEGPWPARAGSPAARPGTHSGPRRGLPRSGGVDDGTRGRPAHGRPPLPHGLAATLAAPSPRPADDIDARRLSAPRLAGALADASRARSTRHGQRGKGFDASTHGTGPGGRRHGAGSARRPLGLGEGQAPWRTPTYWRWYRAQRNRVARAVRFPRARALALDQGTTLLKLWVRRDGSLAAPPRLLRSSGFHDLDQEALAAVRRVVPFSPLPDDLAPGRDRIAILLSVEFSNPMVH